MATLCLDESFTHSWHSLRQLHLECFSNSLEGVPTYAEHLLAAFPLLYTVTHRHVMKIISEEDNKSLRPRRTDV